jgi:hypothetical protein
MAVSKDLGPFPELPTAAPLFAEAAELERRLSDARKERQTRRETIERQKGQTVSPEERAADAAARRDGIARRPTASIAANRRRVDELDAEIPILEDDLREVKRRMEGARDTARIAATKALRPEYEAAVTRQLRGLIEVALGSVDGENVLARLRTLTFRPNTWRRLKTKRSHRTVLEQ